jgi:hypothetical protein
MSYETSSGCFNANRTAIRYLKECATSMALEVIFAASKTPVRSTAKNSIQTWLRGNVSDMPWSSKSNIWNFQWQETE